MKKRLPNLYRVYRDPVAAAKAVAKHLGVHGGKGGMLYTRSGFAFVRGWQAYARELLAHGDVFPAEGGTRINVDEVHRRVSWYADHGEDFQAKTAPPPPPERRGWWDSLPPAPTPRLGNPGQLLAVVGNPGPDERLRRLERAAASGDHEAQARLKHERARQGAPYRVPVAAFVPTCDACGKAGLDEDEVLCRSCKARLFPKKTPRKQNPAIEDVPGFKKAAAKYRKFHGENPTRFRSVRVDDGKQGLTRKVVVEMGEQPEIHYMVEHGKASNKEGVHWVHKTGHKGKGKPLLVLDPDTGLMLTIPTGKTRVNDWIRD